MNLSFLIYSAMGLFAGCLIPIQTSFNAVLGKRIGNPTLSASAIFFVSTLFLALLVLAVRPELPSLETIRETPYWGWLGGILGAIYILCLVVLTPELGVGFTTAIVVLGQVLMGVALDHFGAFGMPQHSLGWMRIIAVGLIGAGVSLLKIY